MANVGPRPDGSAPLCACGCGEPVAWQRGEGWSSFRPGHQSRRQPKYCPDGDAPLCACGCGEQVSASKKRGAEKGWNRWIHGHHIRAKNPNTGEHVLGDQNPMRRPEVRAKLSRARKGKSNPWVGCGEKHPSWKGGRIVDRYGYVRLRINGEYVAEHRYVVEKHIGRALTEDEIIHHKNGAKGDNRIENLEILSQSEHCRIHSLRGDLGPFCACGCGQRTQQSEMPGLWFAVLRGHQLRLESTDGAELR